MRKVGVPLVLLFVLAFASPGQAQEKGQVGLTFAFPASIGLIFHPTKAIGIRPDFTFTTASTDTTGSSGSVLSSSNNSLGFGVSALFYVRTWEDLEVYVSPRFGYTRTNSSSGGSSTTATSGTVGNSYSGSGTVGGQYSLGRRFAVFAEAGVAFTAQTSTATYSGVSTSGNQDTHTWNARGGVGAILYF